jgi:hypothetical protein
VPKAGERHAGTIEYRAACIYGPDGRCVQEVTPSRLHALHQNYCQVREQQLDLCQRLSCKPFAEEMYKMAIHYKTCHKGGQRQTATSMHSWTILREVMDVLAKHLGLQHDRLATPLTYDINMQHYWSNHERDQLLGASWQPYTPVAGILTVQPHTRPC